MHFLYVLAAVALWFVSGCTLNVDEKSEVVPLSMSASGLPSLSIDQDIITPGIRLGDVNANLISVQGISADRLRVSVTANSLEARGDEVDFSAIGMSVDNSGNFSLSYSGPGWQRLTFSGLSVDARSSLPISIKGSIGDISVFDMDSTVSIEQKAGDICADSCAKVDLSLDAGDVTASTWEGGNVDSKSGDVDFQILPPDSIHPAFEGLSIDVNSGDVHVKVSSLQKGLLDLSTERGSVEVAGTERGDSYSAYLKAGSGSGTIRVRVDSGDITVEFID